MLIFVEAKLGSDVSQITKYDPLRNQIVRNIDCALDQAGSRVPMFWMLVRDKERERLYVQLIDRYRTDPDALAQELPHRDLARVIGLAKNLSVVLWRDLVQEVVRASDLDDEVTKTIRNELWRRVGDG